MKKNNNDFKLKLMHRLIKGFSFLLFVIFLYIMTMGLLSGNNLKEVSEIPYIKFEKMLEENKVKTVKLNYDSSNVEFEYQESEKDEIKLGKTANPRSQGFKEKLLLNNVKVIEKSEISLFSLTKSIFMMLFYGVFILYVFKMLKQVNGNVSSITDKKVGKNTKTNYTLNDVIGISSLKESIDTIIKGLKNPKAFKDAGAKLPKGVLLYGPPGTGKTLMAKAIAGEAGVPFFYANGSEFMEMYVGVGASRIRNLFQEAKKVAPAIIYIDEIDAIALKQNENRENSESKQTINQLLTEISGFNENSGIIVLASTNTAPENLHEALMREGRFDMKLAVSLPDKDARLEILKLHSKDKKFDETVNLSLIANSTYGFSGAALETLLNNGAINAVKNNRNIINSEDIDTAFFEIVMKGSPDTHKKEITKSIVAWHEAGHTIVHKLMRRLPVNNVTIVASTSGAGGVTFCQDKEYELTNRQDILDDICVTYGGRAAEELFFKGENSKVTIGASSDIVSATKRIENYIVDFGLNEKYGMLNISALRNTPTNNNMLLEEATSLSNTLYEKTKNFLIENYHHLENVANALIEKETLNDVDLNNILNINK